VSEMRRRVAKVWSQGRKKRLRRGPELRRKKAGECSLIPGDCSQDRNFLAARERKGATDDSRIPKDLEKTREI